MQVSRREMLWAGLGGMGVIGIGGAMPQLMANLAFGRADLSGDNILVVVQLSGGNDGLNTVVPFRDDAYYKARPTIGLKDRLHALDGGELALHPGMTAFKRLFDDGQLAIINGCGYPNPNHSHFKALEIWHSARLTDCQASGWLGRYVDHIQHGTAGGFQAVNVGLELPQAMAGDRVLVPSIQSMDDLPRRTGRASSTQYEPDADYPGGLGQNLRLVAQLISAGLGTRIFYCQSSGFDTHANQLGQHERMLTNTADAIAAFIQDLRAKGYGDKVAVMCFSEFGRRVHQNSSAGTDHGAAGPMFILGGKIKGGIYGAHPSLTDLHDGDLKYTTDFRRVYATLLDRWLNTDSRAILNNAFEPLAFL